MASQTATLTHCPTCGVKLERPELSLCAYCASPLRVGPIEVPNDETQKRLAKVKAHADFSTAQSWLPIDPEFENRARRQSMLGWTALAIGLVVLVIVIAAFDSPRPLAGFASAFALQFLGSVFIGLAIATRIVHRRTPMLKRAAYVLDRRSQTNEQGGIGATLYIFKIRFEDGSEGEFSHIGRGSMYEPPANGAAGVAYTRGARMIEFRRI